MAQRKYIDWPPPAEFVKPAQELLVFLREHELRFTDDEEPDLAFGYWRNDYFFILHRDGDDCYIEIEAPLVTAWLLWRNTVGQPESNPNTARLYGRIREPGILYSLEADGRSWHMTRRDIESYAG